MAKKKAEKESEATAETNTELPAGVIREGTPASPLTPPTEAPEAAEAPTP